MRCQDENTSILWGRLCVRYFAPAYTHTHAHNIYVYLCAFRVSGVFVSGPEMLGNQSSVWMVWGLKGGVLKKKNPNWTSETGAGEAVWEGEGGGAIYLSDHSLTCHLPLRTPRAG